jgi:hypothetical protein
MRFIEGLAELIFSRLLPAPAARLVGNLLKAYLRCVGFATEYNGEPK